MQNWKRRQREEARSVWPRRCRGTVCPQGIFSSSRFWSCSGEETPSYLLDHLAFGSTGSNELAGLCIKSVCFLSSAGGPSGVDRRFGHIAFFFSLIPRNLGFFEQKSPKSWILPKRAGPRWNSNAGRLGRNTGNAPGPGGRRRITGRPQPWKIPSRTAFAVPVLEARSRSWRQSAGTAFGLLIVGQLHLIKHIEHQT